MFEIVNSLKKIDVNTELSLILKRIEDEILSMNTDDQLYEKGITITGSKIKPDYAESTKRTKRRLGMPFDRVTTRMSGGYHKSFKLIIGRTEFKIATQYKTGKGFGLADHLEDNYGRLTGLTEENVNKLIEMIRPLLIESISRKI